MVFLLTIYHSPFAIRHSSPLAIRHPDEPEGSGRQIDVRDQFQQAFVDAAQFLRPHVAVVHRRQRAVVIRPAQVLHGSQQVGVIEARGVEMGTLAHGEQPA
ncbi:hypothetical protein [Methylocaldum sp. GT1BB]